jgi:alpha-tubulin suppressor-like RCC1 family protein
LALATAPQTVVVGAIGVAAGAAHSCAILSGGTVQCWGLNTSGQLGDGTTGGSTTPVAVVGLSNVTQIVARDRRTYALLADGTVRSWGDGCDGRLGVPVTYCGAHDTPLTINISGVRALTAGYDATCALKTDGSVWCWGPNWYGQLGNATYSSQDRPVQVTGLAGALDVSAGGSHACAVRGDGTVTCWGHDGVGQLGDGVARDPDPTPARLVCGG